METQNSLQSSAANRRWSLELSLDPPTHHDYSSQYSRSIKLHHILAETIPAQIPSGYTRMSMSMWDEVYMAPVRTRHARL